MYSNHSTQIFKLMKEAFRSPLEFEIHKKEIIEALKYSLSDSISHEERSRIAHQAYPPIVDLIKCYPPNPTARVWVMLRVLALVSHEHPQKDANMSLLREYCLQQLEDLQMIRQKTRKHLEKMRRIRKKYGSFWDTYATTKLFDLLTTRRSYQGREFLHLSMRRSEELLESLEDDLLAIKDRLSDAKKRQKKVGHWVEFTKYSFHLIVSWAVHSGLSSNEASRRLARTLLALELRKASDYTEKTIKKLMQQSHTRKEAEMVLGDLRKEAEEWLTWEIQQIYKRQRRLHPNKFLKLPIDDSLFQDDATESPQSPSRG